MRGHHTSWEQADLYLTATSPPRVLATTALILAVCLSPFCGYTAPVFCFGAGVLPKLMHWNEQ
jgi:hypothetical protein